MSKTETMVVNHNQSQSKVRVKYGLNSSQQAQLLSVVLLSGNVVSIQGIRTGRTIFQDKQYIPDDTA